MGNCWEGTPGVTDTPRPPQTLIQPQSPPRTPPGAGVGLGPRYGATLWGGGDAALRPWQKEALNSQKRLHGRRNEERNAENVTHQQNRPRTVRCCMQWGRAERGGGDPPQQSCRGAQEGPGALRAEQPPLLSPMGWRGTAPPWGSGAQSCYKTTTVPALGPQPDHESGPGAAVATRMGTDAPSPPGATGTALQPCSPSTASPTLSAVVPQVSTEPHSCWTRAPSIQPPPSPRSAPPSTALHPQAPNPTSPKHGALQPSAPRPQRRPPRVGDTTEPSPSGWADPGVPHRPAAPQPTLYSPGRQRSLRTLAVERGERKVCLALTLQQQEIVRRRLAVSAPRRSQWQLRPTPLGCTEQSPAAPSHSQPWAQSHPSPICCSGCVREVRLHSTAGTTHSAGPPAHSFGDRGHLLCCPMRLRSPPP